MKTGERQKFLKDKDMTRYVNALQIDMGPPCLQLRSLINEAYANGLTVDIIVQVVNGKPFLQISTATATNDYVRSKSLKSIDN